MFKRLGNLIRGFFGLSISGLEKRNPEALLEVEKENLRTQIARYNEGLAAHAGLCERLIAQVGKLEAEESEVRAKTTALLRAGNQELAAPNALRLQTLTRELAENRSQAEGAEQTYQELIRTRDASVQAARQKIEALKFDLKDLNVQRAQAELTEMASGMIGEIGGAGDTLDRLQSMVSEEREAAAGRARVARDSAPAGDSATQAAEQSALAEQALADFAAAEGIALDANGPSAGGDPTSGATKSMGPLTQGQ
jgi:phage shock protein A